ncbi:disintegrin and metalloproteinase domain-containing protein 12-like [Malaya genurostris]|uniref:disintegrin and metalloproteinase domain-containing protein 12-like n=1 Tax=Malaya genurostris TaxID=325434 RepID=UPI0026F397E5|nr:disintegrin and metalloproteinase domain-containing protein 12-like [Malaya genurostris]
MSLTSAFCLLLSVIVAVNGELKLSGPSNAGLSGWSRNHQSEGGFEPYARIFPVLLQNGGQLSVSYVLDGANVTLDLHLNDELVPNEHFLSVQTNGVEQVRRLQDHEVELCHYHGTIRNQPGSYVALSTCNGTRGIVYGSCETYLLEFDEDDSQSHNFVYKLTRTVSPQRVKRAFEAFPSPPVDSFRTAFRSTASSNYVELVLVIDRSLYRITSNIQRIHRYCLDLVNIMNAIYRPLNIYLALVGVVIWTDRDAIDITEDSKKTLENFLSYRRNTLLKMIPHDNAQLLTGVHFSDSVVGKAEMGSMCTYAGSGGVEVVDTNFVALQASTVAHEMGHNFNIDHDGPECRCPSGNCVMASKTVRSQAAPKDWSSCSLDSLEIGLRHGIGACLKNKPAKMFVKSTCGNGLLEPGEECDCGLPHVCDTKCCDALTCRLTVNSTCATGECCDLERCQLRQAGSGCRAATGECDLPEFCDGQTAFCPKNVYLRDTEPCAGGKAFCYQGQCRTRDSQCRVLWGSTAKSIDDYCYQTNLNGTIFGNCGNDQQMGDFVKCRQEDVMCGLLHCSHRNEKLDYGMQAYSKLTTTKFSHYGPRGTVRSTVCNSAIVDLGLEVTNPGLVPDGAKCGTGKMCWKQKCVSLTHLQENDIGEDCVDGCSDHGVCNSEGNCHCDEGYGGQFCEKSGLGGSVDSGPIADPDGSSHVTLALYVAGVILCAAMAGFLYLNRSVLGELLRKILMKFRMRKYGQMVPPVSPTALGPPKPPRLMISSPVQCATQIITSTDLGPTRAAPSIPVPTIEPAQHFIKVNINNSGKVTIENKVVNSPFMLSSNLLDAHEAIHEIKAKGIPAILLEQRSISVDSESPLLSASDQKASMDTPPVQDSQEPNFGTLLSQVKLKKVHNFQNNRSKSDENPQRRLPELPRQKTIGEFQNIIAEVHPKRSPVTEEPPANPFASVTLKKVKPRTPNLSRENLDEITEECFDPKKPTRPVVAPKPLSPKSQDLTSSPKPSLPQKPSQSFDNQLGEGKPKTARKLPQIPPAASNRSRPPLTRKPAIRDGEDGMTVVGSNGNLAALKAKLNLDQVAGGIKR